jgi:transcriptional regulator with XRE-family HTH domain
VRGGEVVKRARVRSGLSVPELAGRLEVSAAEITSWEGGDPPFSVTQRAVEACQISLERLRRMVSYVRFIEAGRAAVKARR